MDKDEKKSFSEKIAQSYYETNSYSDVIEDNNLEEELDVNNKSQKAKQIRKLIITTNITRVAWVLPAPIILAVLHDYFLWAVILAGIYLVIYNLIIHTIFKKTVIGQNIRKVITAMIIADICIAALFAVFIVCYINMLALHHI